MTVLEEIDELVLTIAGSHWQKVAMLVAKIKQRCEEQTLDVSHEKIAERIELLVGQGRLEAQGDLSEWRQSEVRKSSFSNQTLG